MTYDPTHVRDLLAAERRIAERRRGMTDEGLSRQRSGKDERTEARDRGPVTCPPGCQCPTSQREQAYA